MSKKKAQRIHHIFILDRSGSMIDPADPGSKTTKAEVATAGIARYVTEQRGDGVTFTAYEFDTYGTDKIADKASWFNWTCMPRAGTPLLDAVGTVLGLESVEDADRVYVVIATDGEENSSREWTKAAVGKQVEAKRAAGWDVIFIGADFDAFAEGGSFGVARGSTMSTNTAQPGAYAASFVVTSSAVTRATKGGQSVQYTDVERAFAAGKKADGDVE